MIRNVFFGAILVFHSVQSSYSLPVAQQDDSNPDKPMPMSMQESTGTRPMPTIMPIPVQLPTESRQEQPLMQMMSVPMPNQPSQEQPMQMSMPDRSMQLPIQSQDKPMPMHNDPMLIIAKRKLSHARNDHHDKEMRMQVNWSDQQHNHDQMHHGHMTHNHDSHIMTGPKDEHKPERSWSRAPNHPESHESNIHKHAEQMQKHLAEHMHKHPPVDQMHKPSAERSKEDAGGDFKLNRFSNQLVGMHQAQQQYYRPPSPCSRLVVGCSPTVQEVPCSYGSALAPLQPAPYHAAAPAYQSPPASYYAPVPAPQYHVVPSYSSYQSAPSYSDVDQQPGPPYADALLGTTHVHSFDEQNHAHAHAYQHANEQQKQYQHQHDHKINDAQHKDSHPESTNVKTHSNHDEPEIDIKNADEKEANKQTVIESNKTITTTPKVPIDHAVHELKKKIQDHTVAMAQFRQATEEKLRESVLKTVDGHEHKHQHDSCVQACIKKLLESQQMFQKNLLE